MTEHDWRTTPDVGRMLRFLIAEDKDPAPLDRPVRLFCVACCRMIWDEVRARSLQHTVEAAEQYALGLIDEGELQRHITASEPPAGDIALRVVLSATQLPRLAVPRLEALGDLFGRAVTACQYVHILLGSRAYSQARHPHTTDQASALGTAGDEINAIMADLFRCIAGNPFRPVTLDSSWRTSTAVALAEAIHAERAFDRLPILADALEDAGCDDEQVLTHCRTDATHARGCWMVEMLLRLS